MQIANIIAADEEVRRRIDRAININEVCDVNPFGVIATMAEMCIRDRAGVTEYYMYDATNIRLRELSVGYQLPAAWMEKTKVLKRARCV